MQYVIDQVRLENMLTALHVGISMDELHDATCNILFWSGIVSTLTYGCESWALSTNNTHNLFRILVLLAYKGYHRDVNWNVAIIYIYI